MERPAERRRMPRASLDAFVEETSFCGQRVCRSMDISATGIRYIASLNAPGRNGDDVLLEFSLPDDGPPLQALGQVVRDNTGLVFKSTSVVFTALRQEDALRLRRYLEQTAV
jgi:hypothetical protein